MLLKSYIDYATLRIAKHPCYTSAGTTCTAQVKSMRDTGMMPIRGISLLSTWEQHAKKHKGRGGTQSGGRGDRNREREMGYSQPLATTPTSPTIATLSRGLCGSDATRA